MAINWDEVDKKAKQKDAAALSAAKADFAKAKPKSAPLVTTPATTKSAPVTPLMTQLSTNPNKPKTDSATASSTQSAPTTPLTKSASGVGFGLDPLKSRAQGVPVGMDAAVVDNNTGNRVSNMVVGAAKNSAGGFVNALDVTSKSPVLNPLLYGLRKYNDMFAPNATEKAADYLMQSGAENVNKAKEGLNKAGQGVIDVGVGVMQLAGDAAAAVATGGGSMIPAAIRAGGSAAYEAKQSGGSLTEQALYGGLTGGAAALLGKLSNVGGILSKTYGKGVFDKVLQNGFSKAVGKLIKSNVITERIATTLGAAAGEGLEETIEAALSPIFQKLTYDKGANLAESYSEDAIGDMLYEGLIGAIIGGLAGGASPISSTNSTPTAQTGANSVQKQTLTPNLNTNKPNVNVQNNVSVPQQAVQAPTSVIAPKVVTDTAKAVEVPKTQQEVPEANTDTIKQAQAEAVTSANTMTDDYHVGIRGAKDIKTFDETLADEESFVWGDFSKEDAQKAVVDGKVKVYSSKPIGEIGGFVSTSKNMASDYAGNGKVFEKVVPLTDVAWINGDEGQYSGAVGAKITSGMPQGTGAATQGFDKIGTLVNKYGAIPEGAKPHSTERVTEGRIPTQTADDNVVSQTVRTAYEAPVTPNETAEKIETAVLENMFSYEKITDRLALDYASKTVKVKGYETALRDWQADVRSGKVGKKLTALGWTLYNNAANAGNGQLAVEILADISASTRNGAQATQAAMLIKKMSPEYQLYAIQREVQRLNDNLESYNDKQTRKTSTQEADKAEKSAEEMSKVAKEESAKAANDVVGEVAKAVKKQSEKKSNTPKTPKEKAEIDPADLLARKVDSTMKERKAPEVNAINDMVSELFKSAKESPLPERTALAKRSPIEFLTQAIKNKAEYTDVWNGAKDILLEKYSNNPEAMSMLKDYFEKGIVPTYSDATLTAGVKQVLKDLGIKLSTMKELSWDNRQRVIKSLTNYLVEQTGAVDGDAKALKQNAADELTKLIIDSAPKLTKKQKLEIKQATQDALRKHGVPIESWADETGRLIAEGVSKTLSPPEAPVPKAITNIISDDIKKFVGTIKKPVNRLLTRNGIDTYTDFMENRQYYTDAWNKLQTELKAKYANDPEALKAIDNIINKDAETAATDYYNKQLDTMINKALKSINVKLSELITQGKASKQAAIDAVTNILINESGIDSDTAKTVSENIAERFNEMLKERASKRISSMFPSKNNDVASERSLDNKLERLTNLGALESEDFNSIATERLLGIKDVTINPKLADKYVQAKTEEERKAILEDIYHDVATQIPATFADKFDAWRYTAMLFNPVTHIKNTGGNYAFMGERSLSNIMSASIQTSTNTLIKKLGGTGFERTRAILTKKDSALIKTADEDYTKFADDIYKVGKYDDMKSKINDYRQIFGRGGKTSVGNALSKTVGMTVEKARVGNSTVLDAEDMWVSRPAYVKALAGYLKANGVDFKTASPEMLNRARAFAIEDAREAAYRDSNAFSDFVATAGRKKPQNKTAAAVAKPVQILSEGVLPFRRTLANMLVRGVEFSPLGFVKTITYDSYRLAKEDITASEFIENISKGMTGTALFGLGAFLRAQGLLTVGGSGDDKEDKLHETEGFQHFAVNIGGKSYTIDWLAPLVMPIFMGAALYDLKADTKDDGVKLDDVLKIAKDITDPMLEMSMMSSLSDYIDGFSRAKQQDQNLIWYGISQAALGYLGQAIPTIGGRIARAIDPTRRTSFTDPTSGIPEELQYFAQTQLGKIPFAESTKQPYVDQWGRTQESNSLVGRIAQNFLSPGYLKSENISPMEKEIERLYEDYAKENEVNVLPPVSVKKYFSNNGKDVYMTADEYTRYKKTSGQSAYNELTKLTSSAGYKGMTDKEKADAVSDIYSSAAEKAKTEIMEARGEMRIPTADDGEKIQSYIDTAGVSEKQAYSLYKALDALKPEAGKKQVSDYQKISTIGRQKLSSRQTTALVATLYTTHDEETGAVKKESLLPYLTTSEHLRSLYLTTKDSELISMTIPAEFQHKNEQYALTDKEKKLFRETYTGIFNSRVTNITSADAIKTVRDNAYDAAKLAVIRERNSK